MRPGIAYCTNFHAGADLAATLAALELHAADVRRRIVPHGTLGVGLWLSARALEEIASRDDARRLRDRVDGLGLRVVTINGFPHGDFHGATVKHRVYEPHWADPERSRFTQRLAEVLVDLVPDGVAQASISTVPIGWRSTFQQGTTGTTVEAAAARLGEICAHLARLEADRGVRITVDLEPEPGCFLDRSEDVVAFFQRFLPTSEQRRHLGVCHDICHAAVMFESQQAALEAYRSAGIAVNKVQVSSAVEADGSPRALAALAAFNEPRYLHQTCVRTPGGVRFFEDLAPALEAAPAGTWRTHFHVPIHLASLRVLQTTQADIRECLAALGPRPPILEAETYAWNVLPAVLRPATLAEGIADELRWLNEAAP